ncbi:hypothetical protein K492DRAFT_240716 [Lichtheimia hyalospora FSU 10163]|nr:hypothetical protein K492DRAFT_240716 [Lichtheimia hyalospora FSU 10163]
MAMTKETNSTPFSLNMPPSSDPMAPLKTRVDNCVDLISELPLDLVMSNILPRIFGQGLTVIDLDRSCSYLDVCNKWRERIALLGNDIITFSIGSETTMTNQAYRRLRGVAPYIKTLQIGTFTDEFASTLASQPAQLPLLTKLKVGSSPKHWMDHITMPTSIIISYPNLVHLEWISEVALTPQILSYFPNLAVLRLMTPPGSGDLDTLFKHSPKLQQLIIHDSTERSYISHVRIMNQNHGQGLRLLSLQGFAISSDGLLKLMRKHGDTLETCILGDPWALEAISIDNTMEQDIELKRLESLVYSAYAEPECMQSILWIIQHAPNLNAVKTTSGSGMGRVLPMLKHRPIRSIQLACPSSQQQNEYDFIEHHVNLGMDSTLQEIKCIIDQPSSDDHWIRLIPGLKQLKSLELLFRHDLPFEYYIDIDELSELILKLAHGCPSLENLTLHFGRSYPVPSLEWILPLSNHPHLKHLVFEADSGPKDMFTYLRRFQHVGKVHVKLVTCDLDYLADMARRIPNLVYTKKDNR